MLESDAIIAYLFETYGDGKVRTHGRWCLLGSHPSAHH